MNSRKGACRPGSARSRRARSSVMARYSASARRGDGPELGRAPRRPVRIRRDSTHSSFISPMGLCTWSVSAGVTSGAGSPRIMRSVPMMWLRLSWTVHPGRSVGDFHSSSVSWRPEVDGRVARPSSRRSITDRSCVPRDGRSDGPLRIAPDAFGVRRRSAGTVPRMADRPPSVEFFFDPMCPWAYQTSIWIRDVRSRTGLEIRWRFFSLEEINHVEGRSTRGSASGPTASARCGSAPCCVAGARTRSTAGTQEVGRAFHVDGMQTHEREVQPRCSTTSGGAAEVVDEALADPTTADEVRADHDFVVGEKAAWGVPTLVFPDGQAVFGPVVAPAVLGAEARAAVGPGRRVDGASRTSTSCSGPSGPTISARSPRRSGPTSRPAPGRAWRTRRPDRVDPPGRTVTEGRASGPVDPGLADPA